MYPPYLRCNDDTLSTEKTLKDCVSFSCRRLILVLKSSLEFSDSGFAHNLPEYESLNRKLRQNVPSYSDQVFPL